LVIVNGVARTRTGPSEGSVSPQGILVMRSFWNHFDGRIDAQGTIRARATSGCSSQFVWQKAPASTTAFDGQYAGVSRELSKPGEKPSGKCASGVPVPLTIWNGVVRSDKGGWQGAVSPQGVLAIQWNATRVDGQINGQGVITGQGSDAVGCTFTFVWQKQSK
jgi:hypothetical protein